MWNQHTSANNQDDDDAEFNEFLNKLKDNDNFDQDNVYNNSNDNGQYQHYDNNNGNNQDDDGFNDFLNSLKDNNDDNNSKNPNYNNDNAFQYQHNQVQSIQNNPYDIPTSSNTSNNKDNALAHLLFMGFDKNLSLFALSMFNNNINLATEWIIANPDHATTNNDNDNGNNSNDNDVFDNNNALDNNNYDNNSNDNVFDNNNNSDNDADNSNSVTSFGQWQYYSEDKKQWIVYDDATNKLIENAYDVDAELCELQINGKNYEIRFKEMPIKQYNIATNDSLKVERLLIINENINQNQNCKYKWQWKDNNKWKNYDKDVSDEIDKLFTKNDNNNKSLIKTFGSTNYEINVNKKKQINKSTGFKRDIRRIKDINNNDNNDNIKSDNDKTDADKPVKSDNNDKNQKNDKPKS